MKNNMIREKVTGIMNDAMGNYDYIHVVAGDYRSNIADMDKFNKTIEDIKAGVLDSFVSVSTKEFAGDLFIKLEKAGVSNITIDNKEGKEDVKMNNAKEVTVLNNGVERKDDVKMTNVNGVVNNGAAKFEGMTAKNDTKILKRFNDSLIELGVARIAPYMNITVENESSKLDVVGTNVELIREALRTHKWSGLAKGAIDFMFYDYANIDSVFTIKLSVNPIVKTKDNGAKMFIDSRTEEKKAADAKALEARKEATEKFAEHIENTMGAEIEDMSAMINNMSFGEPNLNNIALPSMEAVADSADFVDEDTFAAFSKVAPTTGINNVDEFQKALIDLVIKPATGLNINTKIETTKMTFLALKAFNDKGIGKERKPVSIPWIFKLLNPNFFVILSDVPNPGSLAKIMDKGMVINVEVGRKIVGTNKDGSDKTEPIMKEMLFRYVASSASKQRQERYILTAYSDREMIRKMLVFFSSDFDFGKESQIAKSESRVGTNLSNGVCVGGAVELSKRHLYKNHPYAKFMEFSYVVIPDLTVADFKRMMGQEVLPGDEDKVLADGSGICTMAAMKLIQRKLRNKNAMLAQTRLGKGTFYPIADEAILALNKRLGLNIDPTKPVVLISQSMDKFKVGIDILPLVILRTSERMSDKAFICYETLNALNISSPEGLQTIQALAKEQFEFFKVTKNTDPAVVVHRLGTIARMNKDGETNYDNEAYDIMEDDTLAASLFRFFYANPEVAMRSQYLINKVNELFAKKIADMARGKLMVDGSFCIMMLDPGIWTGTPVLKPGEVYVGGRTGKCLLARYPMAFMSEPQVMTAVDHPAFAAYKGLNLIIMNPFDFAWEKMQGADFDGDACLVTFDLRLVNLVVTGLESPEMEKKEAKKGTLGWEAIGQYFVDNFKIMHPEDPKYVATIGKTNNIVAALLSAAHANGTFLSQETIRRASELSIAINDLIDAAKTGFIPEVDHWYFDTYKLLPNWLAKTLTNPNNKREKVLSWNVPTIENDPESIYFLDKVSPLGRLANNTVPYLYNQFLAATVDILKDENGKSIAFKTDDMIDVYDGGKIELVENQIKGIRSEYGLKATFIFSNDNEERDEDVRSEMFAELCTSMNDRIRKVAATYDILTTAVACLRQGRDSGFAFKCFEEGIIALFEALKGKTYVKVSENYEAKEGDVTRVIEGVRYLVKERDAKDNQAKKFNAASVGKEVTIRMVGLQYHAIKSMNDLKAKIAANKNIIHGGRDIAGNVVALAGSMSIGKVYLDREYSASSEFAQGGYAEVIDVKYIREKSEYNMTDAAFLATKNNDAPIKYADIVVRYIAGPNGTEESTKAPSSPASTLDTMVLPGMGASASAPASDAPVMEGEMSPAEMLATMQKMAAALGMKVVPAAEEKKTEEVWPNPAMDSLFATEPQETPNFLPDMPYWV